MNRKLNLLTQKKARLDAYRPLPTELTQNLDEWYRIELTYTSNAIEGNTLSRAETALIVEKGITVEGKTLNEHLEALNHAQAVDFIQSLVGKKRAEITENIILEIHRLILTKIDENNAGRYRSIPVRIAGSRVVLPNALKVPDLMQEFVDWLENSSGHPVTIAAQAHLKLVGIHPFVDGNGRTARLLMNLLLLQAGYPPVIIRTEDRKRYIDSLENAQVSGTPDDYFALIYAAAERSLDIYLEAAHDVIPPQTHITSSIPKTKPKKLSSILLKIGDVAKATGESVPTLRFWTQIGLLDVKSYTAGGYRLYDPVMVDRVKKIRHLQKIERRTLTEIKELLEK